MILLWPPLCFPNPCSTLTRFSTVSTMSLLLTSPTWIRPTSTANFIWIFLIGTAGLITPAGRTMEPAADTILSPVTAPELAPAAATCCCGCGAEEPGGGCGSRSVSVSEEAEPGGAEAGFSLDISPLETEERSGRRCLSHLPLRALHGKHGHAQGNAKRTKTNKGEICRF